MKKKYQSRSLEKQINAPRTRAWQLLDDLLSQTPSYYESASHSHGSTGTTQETLLSYEPPWRRAFALSGTASGLELCHCTFFLRDDGPTCLLSWGVVIDPEPSPAGFEFLDFTITVTAKLLNEIAEQCEQ